MTSPSFNGERLKIEEIIHGLYVFSIKKGRYSREKEPKSQEKLVTSFMGDP